MDINRATIVGRLTRDPEVRVTPSGLNVVSFGVATNAVWKDRASGEKKEAVEFHNVVAFGKLGEIVSQYMTKGRRILVEGRIQNRSWDAADGTKKYRTEIVAEGIQLGPKTAGESGNSGDASLSSSRPNSSAHRPEPKDKEDIPIIEQETEEVDISDIPF